MHCEQIFPLTMTLLSGWGTIWGKKYFISASLLPFLEKVWKVFLMQPQKCRSFNWVQWWGTASICKWGCSLLSGAYFRMTVGNVGTLNSRRHVEEPWNLAGGKRRQQYAWGLQCGPWKVAQSVTGQRSVENHRECLLRHRFDYFILRKMEFFPWAYSCFIVHSGPDTVLHSLCSVFRTSFLRRFHSLGTDPTTPSFYFHAFLHICMHAN